MLAPTQNSLWSVQVQGEGTRFGALIVSISSCTWTEAPPPYRPTHTKKTFVIGRKFETLNISQLLNVKDASHRQQGIKTVFTVGAFAIPLFSVVLGEANAGYVSSSRACTSSPYFPPFYCHFSDTSCQTMLICSLQHRVCEKQQYLTPF